MGKDPTQASRLRDDGRTRVAKLQGKMRSRHDQKTYVTCNRGGTKCGWRRPAAERSLARMLCEQGWTVAPPGLASEQDPLTPYDFEPDPQGAAFVIEWKLAKTLKDAGWKVAPPGMQISPTDTLEHHGTLPNYQQNQFPTPKGTAEHDSTQIIERRDGPLHEPSLTGILGGALAPESSSSSKGFYRFSTQQFRQAII
ncbi:hypothetical protein CDEST_01315 [Colletotrichum destructivum]|uniref:Uncharacterized protein n=1 Tax=Colletotrichum destructivum TaxID=34406 RepID=A0AAX4HZN9_9PEZI|nr:hypothetical protein CDEST_01315 [Colletotrichum destructivum]